MACSSSMYTRKHFPCLNCYVAGSANLKFVAGVYDRKLKERSERKKEIELARARRATLVLEPDDPGKIHEHRFRNNGAVNFVAIEARNGKDRRGTIIAEIVSVENILTMAIKLLLLTVSFAKRLIQRLMRIEDTEEGETERGWLLKPASSSISLGR
ncbi:hypothetical protein K0M31_000243 [Melipona bicolor]|uniref:Uncharacterized protein n=1 Tax=Melipona bicolor TaxID=60889 RepID=A0AA40GD34_9HYME|nr:hypothetical protein K0M31_000243 [Melipona bicolor]